MEEKATRPVASSTVCEKPKVMPITYCVRSDAMPEGEAQALARIYRFVLDSAMKKGGPASRPGDTMERSRNDRARTSIPK